MGLSGSGTAWRSKKQGGSASGQRSWQGENSSEAISSTHCLVCATEFQPVARIIVGTLSCRMAASGNALEATPESGLEVAEMLNGTRLGVRESMHP